MTKAVLDLGTNTFHLMIGKLVNNNLQVLLDEKQAVKIGENGMVEKVITKPALSRAIATLLVFKQKIEAFGNVETIEVYATSAFRNAKNCAEVCDEILENTGFKVNVISGEEEAALIFEGVKLSGAIHETENGLIIDIGGGSVEFIICNKNQVHWKGSFEIGGLRLLEQFHKSDPIADHELLAIDNYLKEKLTELHQVVNLYQPSYLIGSSGAFDTFVDIYFAKNNEPIPASNHIVLPLDSYFDIHNELVTKTMTERLQVPGMIPLRAEMIVVASAIIKYAIENFALKKIITSRFSLKEGAFKMDK